MTFSIYKTLVFLGAISKIFALPECSSNRPGWADHRILQVPSNMLSGDSIENAWTEALCCVYTHVEVIASTTNKASFELYDGRTYNIKANSFEDLSNAVYEDICDMPMGSHDCSSKSACVQSAFATFSPTSPPTQKPTIGSDLVPSYNFSLIPSNTSSMPPSLNETESSIDFSIFFNISSLPSPPEKKVYLRNGNN